MRPCRSPRAREGRRRCGAHFVLGLRTCRPRPDRATYVRPAATVLPRPRIPDAAYVGLRGPQRRRPLPRPCSGSAGPKPDVQPASPSHPACLGLSPLGFFGSQLQSPHPCASGPHPPHPSSPRLRPRPSASALNHRPQAPAATYPPANRCTSVSLWLILSPACPPGAEAGRGSDRPRRPQLPPRPGAARRPSDGEGS